MNHRTLTRPTIIMTLLLACAVLSSSAVSLAQPEDTPRLTDRRGDMVSVFSGDITVRADTRLVGGIVCIGGDVTIEGEVTQDVVVILGTLENRGRIGGAVTGVLTEQVHRNASIGREMVSVLGSVDLVDTHVRREMINILGPIDRDTLSSTPSINISLGRWVPDLITLFFWFRLTRLLGIFLLLLLLAAIAPERVRLIAEEAPLRYAAAFFAGLLGYLGFLVITALLAPTLIGLPLAILGFWILKWLGIAGILLALGQRLGRALGREMSLLGAILLSFMLYALVTLAPTPLGVYGLVVSGSLRLLFFFIIEIPAVGLIVLTWAGGRRGAPQIDMGLPASPPAAAPAAAPAPAPAPPGASASPQDSLDAR